MYATSILSLFFFLSLKLIFIDMNVIMNVHSDTCLDEQEVSMIDKKKGLLNHLIVIINCMIIKIIIAIVIFFIMLLFILLLLYFSSLLLLVLSLLLRLLLSFSHQLYWNCTNLFIALFHFYQLYNDNL